MPLIWLIFAETSVNPATKSNMKCQLICIVCFLMGSSMGWRFTPLEVDNHPCIPENLKRTNRYICDAEGKVICQSGWKEPDVPSEESHLNPCLIPICDNNGAGCVHGECRAPNFCACEVGWEGSSCDKCVCLPGCQHGYCNKSMECICEPGWEGPYCDIPSCDNCTNGHCLTPNECSCHDGWSGESCDQCETLPGCMNGQCIDHPNTCICFPGWGGHLCDTPVCDQECVHGTCKEGEDSQPNFCLCDLGWRGESCSQCRPYWNCPNNGEDACTVPNECFCYDDSQTGDDPQGLCNNTMLSPMPRNG